MKPLPPFTDLSRLTKALRVLYIISITINLELIIDSLRIYWVVNHQPDYQFSPAETIWEQLANLASGVLGLATFITLMVWVYKSYRNALALRADLSTLPGMAVGYFFIPYLSLFKPHGIVQELWKASGDPLEWRQQKGSGLVSVWWMLYILSSLVRLCTLGAQPHEAETNLAAYNAFYMLSVGDEVLDGIGSLLTVFVVSRIWDRMKQLAPAT